MINLFNKYKRWFYSALFLLVFILMFFPYTIESIFNNLILFNGALGLFTYGHLYLDYWHDGHRLFYKLRATQNMIGGTILILGIIICILTAIFINKKYTKKHWRTEVLASSELNNIVYYPRPIVNIYFIFLIYPLIFIYKSVFYKKRK